MFSEHWGGIYIEVQKPGKDRDLENVKRLWCMKRVTDLTGGSVSMKPLPISTENLHYCYIYIVTMSGYSVKNLQAKGCPTNLSSSSLFSTKARRSQQLYSVFYKSRIFISWNHISNSNDTFTDSYMNFKGATNCSI